MKHLNRIALLVTTLLILLCSSAYAYEIAGNGSYSLYIDINGQPYSTFAGYSMGHNAYGTLGCAWYASARVNQLLGYGSTIRAGTNWYRNAAALGFSSGSTLSTTNKAIACYENHVSIVEGFTSDGNVIISEGGYGAVSSSNGYCRIAAVSESYLKSSSGGRGAFLGFVYLPVAATGASYYLDVNALLDGTECYTLSGFGTCDVYINGVLVADDVVDYYTQWPVGTAYTVTDFKTVGEYTYSGDTSYSGTIAYDTIIRPAYASYGTLTVNVNLNGKPVDSIDGICTFDVYINDAPVATNITSYTGSWPSGTKYQIYNISFAEPVFFDDVGSSACSGVISANTQSQVTLAFFDYSEQGSEWTESLYLPSSITSDTYDIEYYHTYKAYSPNSPGEGWSTDGIGTVEYVPVGSTYVSDFPLETSETRRHVGYYYYHVCSPGTGTRVNFAFDGTFVHLDALYDVGSVYVSASGTDDDDSRYTYYLLKWNDGSWAYCSSGTTCDGSNGTHGARSYVWYRRDIYQDYAITTTYEWTKESGWVSEEDASADTVRYRFRKKDTQNPEVISAGITEITPNGYSFAFFAMDNFAVESIRVGVWPQSDMYENAVWTWVSPEIFDKAHNVTVNIADFGGANNCWYNTAISATDSAGNETIYIGDDLSVYIPAVVHSDKKLMLPTGLVTIEANAFENLTSASEIVIPEGTTTIGSNAFAGCSLVDVIHIPDSVEYIAPDAFDGCYGVVFVCPMDSVAADFARANGIAYVTAE